jgi:hypothetical protein
MNRHPCAFIATHRRVAMAQQSGNKRARTIVQAVHTTLNLNQQ